MRSSRSTRKPVQGLATAGSPTNPADGPVLLCSDAPPYAAPTEVVEPTEVKDLLLRLAGLSAACAPTKFDLPTIHDRSLPRGG